MNSKFALVTGSSTGIGRAIALELSKLGIIVGLVARTRKRLEDTKKLIEKEGGKAEVYIYMI